MTNALIALPPAAKRIGPTPYEHLLGSTAYAYMQALSVQGLNALTGRQQSLADKSGWLVNTQA